MSWIVYSKDGNTERCTLKSLEYSGAFMAERAVTATFEYHSEVAFEVFDYIVYRGEHFELETIPTIKKESSASYIYELRFVSKKYELERCEMRDIVPNDNGMIYPTPLTFNFTGDVRYLAERIQACLDGLYGNGVWSIVVADGVTSEEKNITLSQQNCWNALSMVNTVYGLHFYVKGRNVTIGGVQPSVTHTFEYGKGNGLYEIERASDSETGIVTKLRAYGGTRNLDYSYPKKPEWDDSVLPVSFALSPLRLMLPSFKTDGKTDFVLADDTTIAEYGIREASMVYDDIYPTITGATNASGQAIDEVKAVDAVDDTLSTFTIYLHDLGFDLEEHLTTSDAQISMKTGTLQGYTFNISSIEKQSDNGYKLTLGRNSLESSEESGFYVPNSDWNMKAGDKFVLLNILMPQAYIRDAEERLLVRAKEYLTQYGKTNFSYNIGLHDKFLIEHPDVYNSLLEGSKLSVRDEEIGINEQVTIQSITITENSEENILPQVKVTLNNKPSASTLDRIQGQINDIANETASNNFSSQSELLKQYRKKLDKPFFDRLFAAMDKDGNEIASNDVSTPIAFIKAKHDFLVLGGVTMYYDDGALDIPSIYDGLPIDNSTLVWKGGVLMVNPDIELGGASSWDELEGKPSWITDTKPKYSYSEIQNTPDLSVYATQEWVTGKNYLTDNSLANTLKSYVTITGEETISGKKNFTTGGLFVNGKQIQYDATNGCWKLEGNLLVTGGVTMYADGTTSGGSSAYSTLGSLLNVDDSIDASASVDRVLFQAAGSSEWVTKPLSEIGGSVSGNYLPLSGGTLSGTLLSQAIAPKADNTYSFGYSNCRWAAGHFANLYVNGNAVWHAGNDGSGSGLAADILGARDYNGGSETTTLTTSIKLYEASRTDDTQIRGIYDNGWHLYLRNVYIHDGTNSRTILHSGNIANYNAGSATKLKTARTIWGKSFDGTSNIDGSLTATGTDSAILIRATNNKGSISLQVDNNRGIYDHTNSTWMLGSNGTNTWLNIGNVGFGTTTPNYKVHVVGSGYFSTGINCATSSNATNNSLGIRFATDAAYLSSDGSSVGIYARGNIYLRPGCTSGAGTSSGLGITIAPNGQTILAGDFTMANSKYIKFLAADGTGTVGMYMSTNNNLIIGYGIAGIAKNTYLDGNIIIFRYGSSHIEGMRIDNIGNVGIGTTSPSQKLHVAGNILTTGGITMYSDKRKKTILNHVELSLKQIADAPLVEHYYNSDKNKTTHVGSIAQYWAGLNDWFCKKDAEGFYTMEIQNAALASAISIARHLERYESKTDKKIRKLQQRIIELEDELEMLKNEGRYLC